MALVTKKKSSLEALENGNEHISLEEHDGFLTRKTKTFCNLLAHEREIKLSLKQENLNKLIVPLL